MTRPPVVDWIVAGLLGVLCAFIWLAAFDAVLRSIPDDRDEIERRADEQEHARRVDAVDSARHFENTKP